MNLQQQLNGLGVGEMLFIDKELLGNPQWELRFTRTSPERIDIAMINSADDGTRKYYTLDTAGNPWGAPKIFQEPDLGVSFESAGVTEKAGFICGAIVLDPADNVIFRGSWSKLRYSPKAEERADYEFAPDGAFKIGGEHMGYLDALFLADKNRMEGHVAIIKPSKPAQVRFLEMEDLAIAASK